MYLQNFPFKVQASLSPGGGADDTPYGGICGRRHAEVTGRVKNTGLLGGDTQFGESRI